MNTVWVARVVRERAELATKVRELQARAEAAEKRVQELEQEIDDMYAALEAKP